MNEAALTDRFPTTGWTVQAAVLDATDVTRCRDLFTARLDKLRREFQEWSGEGPEQYGRQQTRIDEYKAQGIPEDLRHYLRGEFDLETRLNLQVVELLGCPTFSDYLRGFLGVDHYFVHYPPMIRFKLPGAAASLVPVHQDSAYNGHLTDFITVWVPLVDIDEECGGVIVYEGSHHERSMQHVSEGSWEAKSTAQTDQWPARHVHMKAGDVLVFPKDLLHESAPHTATDRVRFSIDFRVFADAAHTSKSYYDFADKKVIRRS